MRQNIIRCRFFFCCKYQRKNLAALEWTSATPAYVITGWSRFNDLSKSSSMLNITRNLPSNDRLFFSNLMSTQTFKRNFKMLMWQQLILQRETGILVTMWLTISVCIFYCEILATNVRTGSSSIYSIEFSLRKVDALSKSSVLALLHWPIRNNVPSTI